MPAWWTPLTRRKSIEQLQDEAGTRGDFRRVLGLWQLTAIGIGAIIGVGVFVLAGQQAAVNAGPAVVLSFLVAGIGSACAALAYAEFSGMIPVTGSAYTYGYAVLGELFAWIIGWDLVLEYVVASSTVAHGWAHYLDTFLNLFGIAIPAAWISNPFDYDVASGQWLVTGAYLNLPAALIVLAITTVLVVGIRESARFNAGMVMLKVAVVLFVIAVGAVHVEPANWHPFLPFGLGGVLQGSAYVFFAYIGFDAVSTHAEEAINPQRDLPIGILASLALCTVLYILVAGVLTGMVPSPEIDIHAPVAEAFARRGMGIAVLIISVGALVGITSVLLVLMLSGSRVLLAMARDGLISRDFFGAIHPRFLTPHLATMVMGTAVAVLAALFPLKLLADLVNIGTLLAFVVVCAAVIIMRRTHPDLERPFRTPWVPLVPALGIVVNVSMMLALGWHNWLRLFVWLGIGLVIYVTYGRKRSAMALSHELGLGGASPGGRTIDE